MKCTISYDAIGNQLKEYGIVNNYQSREAFKAGYEIAKSESAWIKITEATTFPENEFIALHKDGDWDKVRYSETYPGKFDCVDFAMDCVSIEIKQYTAYMIIPPLILIGGGAN